MPRKESIGKNEKIHQPRHGERRPGSDPDRSGTRGHELITGFAVRHGGSKKVRAKRRLQPFPPLGWLEPKRNGEVHPGYRPPVKSVNGTFVWFTFPLSGAHFLRSFSAASGIAPLCWLRRKLHATEPPGGRTKRMLDVPPGTSPNIGDQHHTAVGSALGVGGAL
jgi:hypothetical protein